MTRVLAPQRLLSGVGSGGRLDLGQHLTVHGPVPAALRSGEKDLLDLADSVDLRGRGGAGFPFARKARGVRKGREDSGGAPLVVANGSEGEPASRKDAALLMRAPHLVLDGITLAAVAVGAREGRLVVGDPAARSSAAAAVRERRRGSRDRPRVRLRVVGVEDRFVAGESSAVVRASAGKTPVPVFTLTRTAAGGVNGRPTLVSNVETLAQLAVLARLSADTYRCIGTDEEPGTTLVTVHRGGRADVAEVPLGTPLTAVLGPAADSRAVLVGGYHGSWLSGRTVETANLSRGGLGAVGATLGAGLVVPLPQSACPLVEAAPVVRLLADESAGQCGPCVHGLRAIAGAVQNLADGTVEPGDVAKLERWSGLVTGRGACAHPDGVVRFVASLLAAFPTEVTLHQHRACGRPLQGLLPLRPAAILEEAA